MEKNDIFSLLALYHKLANHEFWIVGEVATRERFGHSVMAAPFFYK
jgi:hypothetical protein